MSVGSRRSYLNQFNSLFGMLIFFLACVGVQVVPRPSVSLHAPIASIPCQSIRQNYSRFVDATIHSFPS
ncbi:uncharacterized protein BO97DRAFT_212651 [Aspergillus homomorphus CBS 101889]|uniref:Uncharacterized protein n=1 Tax=Aspergillus homomorphus (strain CBS 101889) TaxID=1450537 RepID=A0A395I8S9_ASPHC|nr:hypothetical protein BO97DRAFT_212651 [Aspergillus homomorphus CBS 101889]RAL15458.1 hypothetical protein BO97DRAFT_212651 [Aspergillus homomorphus CBS 101889]